LVANSQVTLDSPHAVFHLDNFEIRGSARPGWL